MIARGLGSFLAFQTLAFWFGPSFHFVAAPKADAAVTEAGIVGVQAEVKVITASRPYRSAQSLVKSPSLVLP